MNHFFFTLTEQVGTLNVGLQELIFRNLTKYVHRFKTAKDNVCANAGGDFKRKPLVIYHSANQWALNGILNLVFLLTTNIVKKDG